MIVELNNNNCYQVTQFNDTHEWFLEFKTTTEVDNLIEDLKELKKQMIQKKQREFDKKYQLRLNLN